MSPRCPRREAASPRRAPAPRGSARPPCRARPGLATRRTPVSRTPGGCRHRGTGVLRCEENVGRAAPRHDPTKQVTRDFIRRQPALAMKSARHAVFVLDAEDALVHVPSVGERTSAVVVRGRRVRHSTRGTRRAARNALDQGQPTSRSSPLSVVTFTSWMRSTGSDVPPGERDVTPCGQIPGAQCLRAASAVHDHQLVGRRLAGIRSAASDLPARQIDSGPHLTVWTRAEAATPTSSPAGRTSLPLSRIGSGRRRGVLARRPGQDQGQHDACGSHPSNRGDDQPSPAPGSPNPVEQHG